MSNRKCPFSPKRPRRHVILRESSAVTRWQRSGERPVSSDDGPGLREALVCHWLCQCPRFLDAPPCSNDTGKGVPLRRSAVHQALQMTSPCSNGAWFSQPRAAPSGSIGVRAEVSAQRANRSPRCVERQTVARWPNGFSPKGFWRVAQGCRAATTLGNGLDYWDCMENLAEVPECLASSCSRPFVGGLGQGTLWNPYRVHRLAPSAT